MGYAWLALLALLTLSLLWLMRLRGPLLTLAAAALQGQGRARGGGGARGGGELREGATYRPGEAVEMERGGGGGR